MPKRVVIRVGTTAAEAERRLILATLAHCGGSKDVAAQTLGLSLKTLYNRLHAFELPIPRGELLAAIRRKARAQGNP